jgi:hypothetical protein
LFIALERERTGMGGFEREKRKCPTTLAYDKAGSVMGDSRIAHFSQRVPSGSETRRSQGAPSKVVNAHTTACVVLVVGRRD